MKNFVLVLTIVILSFFSFSCMNYSNEGEVYIKQNYYRTKIEVDVSAFNGYVVFNSIPSVRTIMPEILDGSSLNYYLYYIDTLNSSSNDYSYYGKISLAYSSPEVATASVDFDCSVYRFALYATETEFNTTSVAPDIENVKKSSCLAGYTMADLRSASKILFYLSDNSLTSGGKVNLNINSSWSFTSDWQNMIANSTAYVSVGLYDIITGHLALTGGINLNPHILSYNTEISDTLHLSNFGFGGAEIATGTYNLVIKFVDSQNNTSYEYSDIMIIQPNRTSSATIAVPDVIEKKPASPSNFKVVYTPPANSKLSSYLADFTWDDNSNNEFGFEIELADISCGHSNIDGITLMIPHVTNDASWAEEVSQSNYLRNNVVSYDDEKYKQYISFYYDYFENDVNFSPDSYSLLRNNTSARFYLQLGKRYIARIRSVNHAGKSDWAYMAFDTDGCQSVNLYQIVYHTNNDTFVEYHSQLENGVAINIPTSADWKKWHISSLYDSLYPLQSDDTPYPYTGHENIILVGEYNEIDDGSDAYQWQDNDILLHGWAPLTSNDVYFSEYLSGVVGGENKCTNGQYLVISKSFATTLRWEVADDVLTRGYNSITLRIRNTSEDIDVLQTKDAVTNIWSTSIGEKTNGLYIATFTGKKNEFPDREFIFTVVFKLID